MAATTQTQSTTSISATRRYWRRGGDPRPWWPWGLLPLLGLVVLFLFGALVTAPAIEDEVGQRVGKTLAGAGVRVAALAADGQGVTARIGAAGPDLSLLRPLAEATTCATWAGELRCPAAVVLNRDRIDRAAPGQAVAARKTVAAGEVGMAEATEVPGEARRVRQACNEALQDALSDTTVRFRTASAVIDTGNDALLRRLASVVKGCPGYLTIEGHTDSQGDADMNKALSRARADAVRDALAELGVDASRLRIVGYGESRPIADNTTAMGRAANRRIVMTVNESE